MKSLTKFCLILAAVFALAGVLGIVAGMCLGATPAQFLRMVHYNGGRMLSRHSYSQGFWNGWGWRDGIDDWKDELTDGLDDWTDSLTDGVDDWTDELTDGIHDWEDDVEDWQDDMDDWGNLPAIDEIEEASVENIDISEGLYGGAHIEKLKLDLRRSSVKIYSYEGEEFKILAKNAQEYFHIIEDGDTLLLEDYRSYRRKNALVLEIYLPRRSLEKIEMELGASKLYVETLQADKMNLEIGAGDARIDTIETGKLDLELGAGELEIQNMTAAEKAELQVGTGTLKADSCTAGDLELQCGVGMMELSMQGQESDYNYHMTCGIGSIALNGKDYSGLGREKTINNQAADQIVMECGIGEISLEFAE